MSWWIGALVAAGLTPVAARLARGWGWIDRRAGLEARKPREEPVPPVGGVVLFLAGAAAWSATGGEPRLAALAPALLAALALGTLDDVLPGGLTPLRKLAGQVVVAALLAASSGTTGREPVSSFVLALVGMNAVNTWDNADGAAAGLALVGGGARPLGGAVLGFLPWNLARRPGTRVPWAYLGDAGSHLLGVWLAADPVAAWVLVLPALDLLRLSVVRVAAGSRPWVGDRRHLAHRLEAAGRGPRTVALVLALLAAPPVAGRLAAGVPSALAGAAVTFVGLVVVLRHTPDPCPREGVLR